LVSTPEKKKRRGPRVCKGGARAVMQKREKKEKSRNCLNLNKERGGSSATLRQKAYEEE